VVAAFSAVSRVAADLAACLVAAAAAVVAQVRGPLLFRMAVARLQLGRLGLVLVLVQALEAAQGLEAAQVRDREVAGAAV
jgi:hypothetical protein